jgi:hypothetical protein
MSHVLNVRQLPGFSERRPIIPPNAVYIGRRNTRYGLAASQWANPFRVSQEADRASAIAAYEKWLQSQRHLMAALSELQGRSHLLVCGPALPRRRAVEAGWRICLKPRPGPVLADDPGRSADCAPRADEMRAALQRYQTYGQPERARIRSP